MAKKAKVEFELGKKQLVDLILEVDAAVIDGFDGPQMTKLLKLLNKVADEVFPETKNPPECHD